MRRCGLGCLITFPSTNQGLGNTGFLVGGWGMHFECVNNSSLCLWLSFCLDTLGAAVGRVNLNSHTQSKTKLQLRDREPNYFFSVFCLLNSPTVDEGHVFISRFLSLSCFFFYQNLLSLFSFCTYCRSPSLHAFSLSPPLFHVSPPLCRPSLLWLRSRPCGDWMSVSWLRIEPCCVYSPGSLKGSPCRRQRTSDPPVLPVLLLPLSVSLLKPHYFFSPPSSWCLYSPLVLCCVPPRQVLHPPSSNTASLLFCTFFFFPLLNPFFFTAFNHVWFSFCEVYFWLQQFAAASQDNWAKSWFFCYTHFPAFLLFQVFSSGVGNLQH